MLGAVGGRVEDDVCATVELRLWEDVGVVRCILS